MHDWRKLMTDTLLRPRRAAREVLALGLAADVLVQAAVAVTCAGVVLGYLALNLAPDEVDDISATILGVPLIGAMLQLGIILAAGYLTFWIGRMFGGTGGPAGALALVVWLNVMMLVIQAVQLVALILLPPLAAVLAAATVLWALWAFVNFVTELHGFQNPFFVLGGVILTMIVLFFGVAMMLAVLGITPQEPV